MIPSPKDEIPKPSVTNKVLIAHLGNSDDDSDRETPIGDTTKNDADNEEDLDSFTKHLERTQFKHIDLPPPLELIAKRYYKEDEPIKTGAPIAFVSLA